MKSMHGLIWKTLMVIAALTVMGDMNCLRAQKSPTSEVKVVRLKGSARYTTDDKKWKEVKRGTLLKNGALIQTGPDSMVDVCLNDAHIKSSPENMGTASDDVIRLFENSVVSLDKLAREEVQLDLRNGSLMGTVANLPADAKYEIRLPHGFIGIRGGTYIADASGVMNVFEGSAVMVVVAADKSMSTKRLSARQGYDPTTGAVVPLHLQSYPLPLTCAGSELPSTPNASSPTSGLPHGSGMGGSLRKF